MKASKEEINVLIKPYGENNEESKTLQVQRMFNRIAPSYNRLNRIMTMGVDLLWRKRVVGLVREVAPRVVLDAACGTGDLSFMMYRGVPSIEKLIGIDFSEQMLSVARRKADKKGYTHSELDYFEGKEVVGAKLSFRQADCLHLPFSDNTVDVLTCAFGIRNFEDLSEGLREFARVLKPGGRLVILELSSPTQPLIKVGYEFYAYRLIPLMGRLLTTDGCAYSYLPRSVNAVPQKEGLICLIKEAGFGMARFRSLSFGVATLYVAEKVSA